MSRLPGVVLACAIVAAGAVGCVTAPSVRDEPAPAQEEVTGWDISPADGYSDSFGYVRLDFTPARQADDGGRLTVHLGRQSLEHANTAWYRFTVREGSTVLLNLAGAEDVPNIKGPDGNWWSTIELDLPQLISREIRVEVEDRKIGATYAFTVRKVTRLAS